MARGPLNKRIYKNGKENKFREEHLSENRRAWLKTFVGQFILKISPPEEENEMYGDSVWLVIPRPGLKPVQLNLTALTAEELDLTRQFFNAVFDIAEPLCKERDKAAADAYAKGDDSHVRLYRAVPELIVRKGTLGAHGEVLRSRLANVSTGPERHASIELGLRDEVHELAAGQSERGEAEDNSETSDEPPSVRQMGGLGDGAGRLLPAHPGEADPPPSA